MCYNFQKITRKLTEEQEFSFTPILLNMHYKQTRTNRINLCFTASQTDSSYDWWIQEEKEDCIPHRKQNKRHTQSFSLNSSLNTSQSTTYWHISISSNNIRHKKNVFIFHRHNSDTSNKPANAECQKMDWRKNNEYFVITIVLVHKNNRKALNYYCYLRFWKHGVPGLRPSTENLIAKWWSQRICILTETNGEFTCLLTSILS